MEAAVRKWGNSLALRIPSALAKDLGLRPGAVVELEVMDGELVVRPRAKRAYSLPRLVKGVSASNRHDETDWGRPAGREAW